MNGGGVTAGHDLCRLRHRARAGAALVPGVPSPRARPALTDLAARAEAAAAAGDVQAALAAWRSSLELLPPDSRQSASVAQKIASLARGRRNVRRGTGRDPELGPVEVARRSRTRRAPHLEVQVPGRRLLTKGKLLLLGLTKAGTLASMFASVGLYWTQWGLWFALGLVLSIYVHEMGHVAAIRRYGIAASAPMFIPGFGALIRLKQAPVTPRENARIGLAGPVWGLGAAVAAALAGQARRRSDVHGHRSHRGVDQHAQPGAGLATRRQPGFRFADAVHRWIATAALGAAWMLTARRRGPARAARRRRTHGRRPRRAPPDRGALALFVFVTLALAVVCRLTQGASCCGC